MTFKQSKTDLPSGNNGLETVEDQRVLVHPTPQPKIDLHDAHAIRREMASLYRDMRNGRIATQDGTRLAYVLDMVRKAYETDVMQDRLELLERTLEHRN